MEQRKVEHTYIRYWKKHNIREATSESKAKQEQRGCRIAKIPFHKRDYFVVFFSTIPLANSPKLIS